VRHYREAVVERTLEEQSNVNCLLSAAAYLWANAGWCSLLRSLGAKIDIWRVAIKPGKPFLFSALELRGVWFAW
jgi:hypothetical protein